MAEATLNSIQTYSGKFYDFENPDPKVICLDDIAHATANACRFAGHTARFYSVAEHSVRVSWIIAARGFGKHSQIHGLLHDAHEAYVWDCPRPFKPLLGAVYERYAQNADHAIATRFLGAWHRARGFHGGIVKDADDIALVAEAHELMNPGPTEWPSWESRYRFVPEPPQETMDALGWGPEQAERIFRIRARALGLA